MDSSDSSGISLNGLYSYTRYTKDIRNSTLATARAVVEPLLACSFIEVKEGNAVFEVTNVGNGMALNVRAATILGPRGLGHFFDISEADTSALGDIRPNSVGKPYSSPAAEKAIGETIIIQAGDVNGDTHQLHLAVLSRLAAGTVIRQARVSDRHNSPASYKRKVVKDENDRNA